MWTEALKVLMSLFYLTMVNVGVLCWDVNYEEQHLIHDVWKDRCPSVLLTMASLHGRCFMMTPGRAWDQDWKEHDLPG